LSCHHNFSAFLGIRYSAFKHADSHNLYGQKIDIMATCLKSNSNFLIFAVLVV